ncbi:MAG: alcohol dehydrogenase, partial [Gammaproteobacteria bacterium]
EPLVLNAGPIVVNELTIVGSRCGPMDKAVAMIAAGKLDPSCMVTKSYPLDEGVKAVGRAQEKGTLKILLSMG